MNPCHKHNTLVSSYYHVTDWMCVCSPNSYIEIYPHNVIISGGGILEKSLGLEEVMRGDSSCTALLSSWGSQDTLLPLCSPPCEDIDAGSLQPWRGFSPELHPAGTLISHLQPPGLWQINFYHWWSTRLWDLVRAAWTKTQGMAHLAPAVH